MDDFDYDSLTNEEIDAALIEIVSNLGAEGVLAIGDVYSILREEFDNEVLELAKRNRRCDG